MASRRIKFSSLYGGFIKELQNCGYQIHETTKESADELNVPGMPYSKLKFIFSTILVSFMTKFLAPSKPRPVVPDVVE